MPKRDANKRPDFSKWFADLAATPGLTDSHMRVACRVGAVGMTPNAQGHRLYFESLDTLQAMTGASRSTCQRALARLVKLGLLTVAKRATGRGHPTRYALRRNFQEDVRISSRDEEKGCQAGDTLSADKGGHSDDTLSDPKGGHPGDTPSRERVSNSTGKGVKALTEKGVTQVTRESSLINKNGPDVSAKAANVGPDPNPPSPVDLDARRKMLRAQGRALVAAESQEAKA